MSINQALLASLSADKDSREQALEWLEAAQKADLPNFIIALAQELGNHAQDQFTRQQAALQLKNCLISKDDLLSEQKAEMWRMLPAELRNGVKLVALSSLGTEAPGPSAAAQVISTIAVIEMPHNMWPEVMMQLVQNIRPESSEALKTSTLEAIGYICEQTAPEYLEKDANDLLTVIVQCMHAEEPSSRIRLAATTALTNSLEFCRRNFENAAERAVIMQVVCNATVSPDSRIKVAALECLVKIMSLYYKYMEDFMGEYLFPITVDAMKSDDDKVALQGIEFWSNVCDEEIELDIALADAPPGLPPTEVSKYYCKGATEYVVPILAYLLAKQDEGDDEDDWNVSKAASVCLALFASCAGDVILTHVFPFIEANVTNPEWNFRDAAVLAFGSILEGPSPEMLVGIINRALPHIIDMLAKDPSPVVKDSVAWLLGRVIDQHPGCVMNDQFFLPLINCLMGGLGMEPRVASNACWAFNALAESAYEMASGNDGPVATYSLSPYFTDITAKLFEVTDRPDAGESNLRCAAYEALMSLMQYYAEDCYPTVLHAAHVVVDRLQNSLGLKVDGREQLSQYTEMQASLCALLQVLLREMSREDVASLADAVMTILLTMFTTVSGTQHNVQEDAFMAMSSLIETLNADFLKYVEAVKPYLIAALVNIAEYQVCYVAVGLVGDICRALQMNALPFCEEFMQSLMSALANPVLDRSVKPHILASFGDVALAIGTHFKPYLTMTLDVLQQASVTASRAVANDDYDTVDNMNELREGCLEAYTGILHSLKGEDEIPNPDVQLIRGQVTHIVQFIDMISQCETLSENNVRASLGLLGDLCGVFGQELGPLLSNQFTDRLITLGMTKQEDTTKVTAKWAKKQIQRARGS